MLIKTVFKVDMIVCSILVFFDVTDCNGSQAASEKANINAEFRPNDNRYLIVHEFPGLDPQSRNLEDLQTILDFVSHRNEANRAPPERLHAIW